MAGQATKKKTELRRLAKYTDLGFLKELSYIYNNVLFHNSYLHYSHLFFSLAILSCGILDSISIGNLVQGTFKNV